MTLGTARARAEWINCLEVAVRDKALVDEVLQHYSGQNTIITRAQAIALAADELYAQLVKRGEGQ